ncbi:MAG: SGNH/GDSL hydrolase family protein [Candidatus Eisenbacteria bacterium]|uniref:SGNH/GDSL hydrolase family protein n=1 Tax=Eiseniibacteriota bacterium TaxID=2212470 RepID=A0A956SIK5_UNCEI|nr:SGNH/GDSL hydrolase family protein [Candidatus Eisenbacteria bacterium]
MCEPASHPTLYRRYVAIGDSSTEGWIDRDDSGRLVGWSRRLAQKIADVQGELLYANLGVHGLTTREIRERQLEAACSLEPDLVTLFSGTNDVINRRFDPESIEADIRHMHEELFRAGTSKILTFTLPDLTPIMPIARFLAGRILQLNSIVLQVSSETGATALDLASVPVAVHPALWHEDRIHANSEGHRRIAAALAHALELPGSDDSWSRGLDPPAQPSLPTFLANEASWALRYLLPWTARALRNEIRGKEDACRSTSLVRVEQSRSFDRLRLPE